MKTCALAGKVPRARRYMENFRRNSNSGTGTRAISPRLSASISNGSGNQLMTELRETTDKIRSTDSVCRNTGGGESDARRNRLSKWRRGVDSGGGIAHRSPSVRSAVIDVSFNSA